MRRTPRPPVRARGLAAGAVTLLLVPASVGLASPAPAGASGDQDRAPVRLLRAPGSAVRDAEVGLRPGVSRLETSTYSMVAATWHGRAPRVSVRTGPGEPWQRLPLLEDGPSVGAAEGDPGLSGTDLVWTGPSSGIDVRVSGSGYRDLELVLIEPEQVASDRAAAVAPRRAASRADVGHAPPPEIRSRRDWGANPRWRNGRPRYNRRLLQVHVHHTATGNSYSRADVPGLIRGMYRYHTHSLGWFDIGYNFLVDRFGRAWEGRSGGFRRLVRGAHTLGFNHQSVGIAMIGSFGARRPRPAAVTTITRLTAWKLDMRGRDARGKVRTRSTGSDKYRRGRLVWLPAVDGHRDTNDTACPGQRLYRQLPTIRRRAQHRINIYN